MPIAEPIAGGTTIAVIDRFRARDAELDGSKNRLFSKANRRLLGLGEQGIGNGGAIGIF